MKKNEMEALVEGLRKIGADIAGLADALEGKQEKGEDVQAPPKTASLEEVRAVLAEKARSGFRAEVKSLLAAHGAKQLSDITGPAELAQVLAEAEVIGNG